MSYSSNTNGKYRGGPPNKAFSTAGVIAIAILGPTAVLASMFLWMNNSSPQARSSDGGKKLDDSRSFFDSRLNWLRGDGSSGGSAKQNAVMTVPVPRKPVHKALDMAFPMEGIRLQKIALQSSVTGDAENWRLCHSADPKVTLCPNASFFAVAQNDGFSDPVVDWLVSAETHVQDLFAAILSTNIKNSCLRSTTPCLATASQFTATEREKLVMLDIGSNHGFYSLMAAATAPWLQVYAFEPQPHCAMYITLALEASGFEEQMFVLNNLAGTKALAAPPKKSKDKGGSMVGRFHVPARSKASVAIPRRTGCRGTFPTMMPDELAAVKLGYAKFPEALETVDVTYVNPSELVPLDYSVLMAKIDVEGFEEEASSTTSACVHTDQSMLSGMHVRRLIPPVIAARFVMPCRCWIPLMNYSGISAYTTSLSNSTNLSAFDA